MLLLIFEAGDVRYALTVDQIVEIVPLVRLEKLPTKPNYVAGLMNYRGKPVPVVDLCSIIQEGICKQKMSTRIILIQHPFTPGPNEMLGLVAEKVTNILKCNLEKVPTSGAVMNDSIDQNDTDFKTGKVIQWFDIKQFLAEYEICTLFKD